MNDKYTQAWQSSVSDPETFWGKAAESLDWSSRRCQSVANCSPFSKVGPGPS